MRFEVSAVGKTIAWWSLEASGALGELDGLLEPCTWAACIYYLFCVLYCDMISSLDCRFC